MSCFGLVLHSKGAESCCGVAMQGFCYGSAESCCARIKNATKPLYQTMEVQNA